MKHPNLDTTVKTVSKMYSNIISNTSICNQNSKKGNLGAYFKTFDKTYDNVSENVADIFKIVKLDTNGKNSDKLYDGMSNNSI